MSSAASLFSIIARGANRAPKAICPKCQHEYTLGVNGTVDGCDRCTHTTRAINGYAVEDRSCCCYEYEGDNELCPKHGKSAHWVGGE